MICDFHKSYFPIAEFNNYFGDNHCKFDLNKRIMKTGIYDNNDLFDSNYSSLKKLKRAEKLAWFSFIGIGLAYITITLIQYFA